MEPQPQHRESARDPVKSALRVTHRRLPHWEQAGRTYFVTFRTDGTTLSEAGRQIVLGACLFWHESKWIVEAVVVMPDHLHLLARPCPMLAAGDGPASPTAERQYYPLSQMLHSVKSYTASAINRQRGTAGRFWLPEHFDRVVRDQYEFDQKLRYMADNPVKAALCRDFLDYPYYWQRGRELPARASE